jgi:hypothetical protein
VTQHKGRLRHTEEQVGSDALLWLVGESEGLLLLCDGRVKVCYFCVMAE